MKKAVFTVVGITVLAFLTLLVMVSVKDYRQATQTPVTASKTVKEQVKPPTRTELLKLVNAERKKVGVAPLVIDERLNKSAQAKVNDMQVNNYFDHVSPKSGITGWKTIDSNEIGCTFASENLLKDYTTNPISDFRDSPDHWNAIISKRYDSIGFGIDKEFIVLHFCDLPN